MRKHLRLEGSSLKKKPNIRTHLNFYCSVTLQIRGFHIQNGAFSCFMPLRHISGHFCVSGLTNLEMYRLGGVRTNCHLQIFSGSLQGKLVDLSTVGLRRQVRKLSFLSASDSHETGYWHFTHFIELLTEEGFDAFVYARRL